MLLHCLNSFGYIEASANAPIQQENLQDMSQAMFFYRIGTIQVFWKNYFLLVLTIEVEVAGGIPVN